VSESLQHLEIVSPELHARLRSAFSADERGFFPIVVQGDKSALDLALCQSLLEAITSSDLDTGWVPSELAENVHLTLQTLETGINRPADVVDLFKQASKHAKAASYKGLLVVGDEFGKFLERAAEQGEVPDLIAAQYLAEHASSSDEAEILFLVLLHQNFRDYASGQTQTQRQEWSKIQGRFKQVDFTQDSEDLYSLIAACLGRTDSSVEQTKISAWSSEVLEQVRSIPLFAGEHNEVFWADLLPSVYPFHPIALFGLPRLSSRLGQNERTLFTFLVSEDPLGLKRFLLETSMGTERLPSLTFDVVVDFFLYGARFSSWPPDIYQSISQLESALERLGDRPVLESKIVKIIGGIRLLRSGPTLPCDKGTIIAALGLDHRTDHSSFDASMDALLSNKIIVHRKFSDEYHLWEGSDFDFDRAIETIRDEKRNEMDPSGALPDGFLSRPIIANQHGLLTGNTRSFSRIFILARDLVSLDVERLVQEQILSGASGVIIHSAPSNVADVRQLQEWAIEIDNERVMVTVPDAPCLASSYIEELGALKTIKETNPEIQEDPVALKELNAREEGLSLRLEETLATVTEPGPHGPSWWWNGVRRPIKDRKTMNRFLSQVSDHLYPEAPIILNELVNRSYLPTAVVIAVKKIIAGLLEDVGEETLGFEGNGPEVSIFKSVLEKTGVYQKDGSAWRLVRPDSQHPTNLLAPWAEIERFLEQSVQSEVRLSDLVSVLEDRPYGLKRGIIPLLVWTVLIHQRDSICLYYDGTYLRNWDIEIFDLSSKVPDKFTIRRIVAEQATKTIISGLASVLLKEPPEVRRVGVNTVLFGLFNWYRGLTEYARQTDEVSSTSSNLRQAITSSADPIDLLFRKIPESLGLEPFLHEGSGNLRSRIPRSQTLELVKRFNDAVADIDGSYDRLIAEMVHDLSVAFSATGDVSSLSASIGSTAAPIMEFVRDPQAKAFLNRASNNPEQGDDQWVEALGATLTNQSPKYWTNLHVSEWKEKLSLLSLTVRDAEKRRFAMQRVNQETGSVRLLIESSTGSVIERIFDLDALNKYGDSDSWLLANLKLSLESKDELLEADVQEILIRALSRTIE
jgi:hypothetical protein